MLAIARRGTGIKWAIMMEHLKMIRLWITRGENEQDVLGPTPVKSRRSMTSACWEPFLERDFPDAFDFSTLLAESWDWERLADGLELGEGLRRGLESAMGKNCWAHTAV